MTEEQRENEERKALADKAGEPNDTDADDDREDMDEGEAPDSQRDSAGSKSQMKIWIAVAVGAVIALLFVFKPGTNAQSGGSASVGSTVNGDLTLVAADRNELECAAAKGYQNYQCGFVDEKQSRTLEDKDKLRPFMTVDRQLYLIPGLFLEPSILQRFNAEPAFKPRAEQKRFTAKCQIKIVSEIDGVKLRWAPDGTWEPAKKFPVATVSGCKIEG